MARRPIYEPHVEPIVHCEFGLFSLGRGGGGETDKSAMDHGPVWVLINRFAGSTLSLTTFREIVCETSESVQAFQRLTLTSGAVRFLLGRSGNFRERKSGELVVGEVQRVSRSSGEV